MTSSETPAAQNISRYPEDTMSTTLNQLISLTDTSEEQQALATLVRLVVPPPDVQLLSELLHPLLKTHALHTDAYFVLDRCFARHRQTQATRQRWRKKEYPYVAALRNLYRINDRHLPTDLSVVRWFINLGQRLPARTQFSREMYYKHIIGCRDVCKAFWHDWGRPDRTSDSSGSKRRETGTTAFDAMKKFVQQYSPDELSTANTALKYRYVSDLLANTLLLGQADPRGSQYRRGVMTIGSRIQLSETTLGSVTKWNNVQSSRVAECYLDDDGVHTCIVYPDGASRRDRRHINRSIVNGFARSCVKTEADMAALSVTTYITYLRYAAQHSEQLTFAFIWLSAFAGLDVKRPLVNQSQPPRNFGNDAIVVDRSEAFIEYEILRRRHREKLHHYETAGRMRLPVPQSVWQSLKYIAAHDLGSETKDSADRCAKQFSNMRPGLTPTLRRLRASARRLMTERLSSELTFYAISGRIPPDLKGISAYYPHRCHTVSEEFIAACNSLSGELRLPDASVTRAAPIRKDDYLFCAPSPSLDAIKSLFREIAERYDHQRREVLQAGMNAEVETLIELVNTHETARYLIQQFATGLRPIGDVGNVAFSTDHRIAFIQDKSSCVSAERSYSPISNAHERFLACSEENRLTLLASLRLRGRRLVRYEKLSDLALTIGPFTADVSVEGIRLQNARFQNESCIAARVSDVARQFNWIRHVATQHFAQKVPQWMLDELMGHMRVGRQPLAHWSTAGAAHFDRLRRVVDDALVQVIDGRLLKPISLGLPAGLQGIQMFAQGPRVRQRESRRLRVDSILPATAEGFARLQSLGRFYIWLWEGAALAASPEETDLLRVYLSLLLDCAFPHSTAVDCILALDASGVCRDEPLLIPIHRHETTDRSVALTLHDVTRVAVGFWLYRRQSRFDLGHQRRCRVGKRLNRLLESQFERARELYAAPGPLRFRDLARLAALLAVERGAEPFLMAALNSKVRPTTQSRDDHYQLEGISAEALNRVVQSLSVTTAPSMPGSRGSSVAPEDEKELPATWIGDSRRLLRELCRELQAAHPGRMTTTRLKTNAMEILRRYRLIAQSIAPEDSALVLAIDYALEHYVRDAKIVARSLRDYLDRAVIYGLLDVEAAYSLGDWEPDDFIEVIEARISNPRLSATSRQLILNAFSSVLSFINRRLGHPRIPLAKLRQNYVAGSGQHSLISPFAIDQLIAALYALEQREAREAAVVIALANYGGLRGSEVSKLTLENIVFDDEFERLDIELLRGKTHSSRRRLPFSSLAPPDIVMTLKEFWHSRRKEFREDSPLSRIALFGAPGDPARYQQATLSVVTRRFLKATFGASATLHLLRHCFCSFLLLRWYALRHPTLLDNLRDRGHPIFHSPLQDRLRHYFNGLPRQDGDIRPYDLISIIKLTGHASAEVYFQYYVHSYSVIQRHAVAQIASIASTIPLSGRQQAALIPGMKSSASRAKRRIRVVGELAGRVSAGKLPADRPRHVGQPKC